MKNVWLGLGLIVFQLGAVPAWAAPSTAAAASARTKAVPKPLVRRVFNPANKTPLPASWPIAGQTYVSQAEYQDLSNGVQALLKKYPPNKYFFVGLGRDPAPVIAFLQNLGEKDVAVNLPGTSNIQWANRGVQPADVARHIEAAIPAHILKGDRQIVILDVTSTGKTPAVFGPYIDTYLASHGSQQKVVRLAFSWNNVKANPTYGPQLTDWIDTTGWADFSRYFTGKYEGNWAPGNNGQGIAEHQRHEMGPGVQPPTVTSPNYAAFRGALLARMQQDAKLDEFLLKEVGADGNSEELAAWQKAQRTQKAQQLVTARAFPTRMRTSLDALVGNMPKRDEGHEKGPYLSTNGEALDAWLQKSFAELKDVSKDVPALAKDGANKVTTAFMDKLETAVEAKQIRNRDYRRLIGHAISASVMDAKMIERLTKLYKTSKNFHREVDTEADYFVSYFREKQRPGTEHMEANFRALMAHIDPARQL